MTLAELIQSHSLFVYRVTIGRTKNCIDVLHRCVDCGLFVEVEMDGKKEVEHLTHFTRLNAHVVAYHYDGVEKDYVSEAFECRNHNDRLDSRRQSIMLNRPKINKPAI